MRPVLTGLFFCLGGVLGGSFLSGGFFRLRSLDGGRLVSLGLVVGDNDLKIVVRGSGLGLGGRFVFAEGGDEVLQLGDGLLGLVDLLAPRQILGSVELFTDGIVAVIQLAQLDLGLFDLVVIDLLWWRNTKRTRFSFLPEKKYYQNPKKHIESFWRGIPLFAAVAALSALIVTAF